MTAVRMSPAHAAAVSRALTDAGIPRAQELRKGLETTGYNAGLRDDHVRVEYVTQLVPEANQETARVAGLDRCRIALQGKYDVRRVLGQVAYPGEWHDEFVLEVRRTP